MKVKTVENIIKFFGQCDDKGEPLHDTDLFNLDIIPSFVGLMALLPEPLRVQWRAFSRSAPGILDLHPSIIVHFMPYCT